jgi:RimK family alpha-L-glutamate ligase
MNQILYCIIKSEENVGNKRDFEYFSKAALSRDDIDFQIIESEKVDFTNLPVIETGSAVYRMDTDYTSSLLERMLLNESHKTFYDMGVTAQVRFQFMPSLQFLKHGIKTPKTIHSIYNASDELLEQYSNAVGGFPVVLKAPGGSHSSGIFMCNSIEEIKQVRDRGTEISQKLVMKQFIDFRQHARLVVIGDVVVDSIEYSRPDGEFRTNLTDDPIVKPEKFSDSVEELAVAAAQAVGARFAGVDIVIDAAGEAYVLEVNSPCNFARNQMTTGVNIAEKMVDFLINQ